jgi:uncharacterized membrane protein YeaQ/YmgE (transglycosylase-associated protein family)
MKWNAARSVPWKRLCIEWLIIGVVVSITAFVFTNNRSAGNYLSILLGGVVYVAFGAVLAKLGYSRKTLKDLRAEVAAQPPRQVGRTTSPSAPSGRPRPAPTSRTSNAPRTAPRKKRR